MNDKITAIEAEIVDLLKTTAGVKTCKGYRGEMDNLKKLTAGLPAIYIWYDNETYQKEGQASYTRRPEFHALVVTKNTAKESARRASGLDIIDLVLDKLEAIVFDLRGTEVIENSSTYFIAAVKFVW